MAGTRRRARASRSSTAVLPEYPLIALRETVLFPRTTTPLLIGRERLLLALEEAMDDKQMVVLVAYKDATEQEPTADQLHTIGTLVEVGRLLTLADGSSRTPTLPADRRTSPSPTRSSR